MIRDPVLGLRYAILIHVHGCRLFLGRTGLTVRFGSAFRFWVLGCVNDRGGLRFLRVHNWFRQAGLCVQIIVLILFVILLLIVFLVLEIVVTAGDGCHGWATTACRRTI